MERYENKNNFNTTMGGVHGHTMDESKHAEANFNLNQVEERIYAALENYDRVCRRYTPVEAEVIDFLKTQFGAKKVDGIRVVDLKTDHNGMPKTLIFNIINAGSVVEKYRNSEVLFDEFGNLNYSLKIAAGPAGPGNNANQGYAQRGGSRGAAGFSARGNVGHNYNGGQQVVSGQMPKKFKFIFGGLAIATVISTVVAFCAINTASEYKETSIANQSAADKYEQQIKDIYKALNSVGYKFENGGLVKITK